MQGVNVKHKLRCITLRKFCISFFWHILAKNKYTLCNLKFKLKNESQFAIGHIRYINILTWPQGFQVKLGVVFFVSKSLLGIERQKKLEKFAILTRKPRSYVRILIYQTWPIVSLLCLSLCTLSYKM